MCIVTFSRWTAMQRAWRKGKYWYDDWKSCQKRTIVQKALDAVRVIGNKAVHPGQIAFDVDDKSTAETLMKLLNIITERLITEPKEIDTIFSALPQSAKESIEKRDKLC